MVNNNLLSLEMSKCILSVKFSYVRFISQLWKYVYNTFNVLFTSHLHPISFCWATYWAPVELLWESFLSHVTWLCYFLHELWWADLIHPLNVLMHSSVREFWFSMWLDVLLFPSMNWGPWGWLNPSSECVVAFSVNTQVDWFLGKFFLWSSTLYYWPLCLCKHLWFWQHKTLLQWLAGFPTVGNQMLDCTKVSSQTFEWWCLQVQSTCSTTMCSCWSYNKRFQLGKVDPSSSPLV
jgi:hypothetical protein